MTRIALPLLALLAGPVAAADRPNFVFVFTDDQRYDALSCVQKEQGDKGRFPFLQTPNLDRLATGGVRFRNAFVTCSLCSPSRAAFLTGRYNHANGITGNTTPFPADTVTHASLLKAAGYRTGYVGKWHMGQQPARPGFDWSASYTGQGLYDNTRFLLNGQLDVKPGWVDDRAADYAVRFLEESKANPFLLVVGFKSAHGPFTPPDRVKEKYTGETARTTPNFLLKPGFNTNAEMPKREAGPRVPVNLNYMRCLTAMDENLGRLLDTLDRLKLTDNTVVVFASDNGFYLGEHGLADKRSAYEESIRIPLLVRYPKLTKPGTTCDAIALNIDLAPTFLDLAGVPIPKDMHGRSWTPLLGGQTPADWRKSFFYEYFFEAGGKNATGPGGFNTPTLTAVRTETAKLIRYAGHPEWTEVFNLKDDPFETKNLADVAGPRAELDAEHDRLAKALDYKLPGK